MEAQKLAGKLVFLQTTTFGNVGRALTYPLYARAHGLGHDAEHVKLNHPLRDALLTLLHVLKDLRPRTIPMHLEVQPAILYTDAFFAMGDRVFKPTDPEIPTRWNPSHTSSLTNGWGFVFKDGRDIFVAHGVAPPDLITRFCSRRAFIYFLELLAPTLAICLFSQKMTPFVIAFVDNTASLAALNKGYGRDSSVNHMVAFLWCVIARCGLHPHFSWVQSSHNVSDSVSRHDLTDAIAHGWNILDVKFDELYGILIRCADDLQYACSTAVDDALQWAAHVPLCLTSCFGGREVPEMGTKVAPPG